MSGLGLRYGLIRPLKPIDSVEEAQAIWLRMRDQALEQGLGRKDLPVLTVVDVESASTVARLSWDGKAWTPEGKEYEAPQ